MTSSAEHYRLAQLYVGLAEVPGRASNPEIKRMILATADWLDGDDSVTAWCGSFRAHIGMRAGTGVPPAAYRAANWAKWGTEVKRDYQNGDTVVLSRPGGFHVALYAGRVDEEFYLLGGNQANKVGFAMYPRESVVAVRR